MTKAEQIAGYLKLSSAHFSRGGDVSGKAFLALELREQLAAEMDVDTLLLAHDLKRLLGGFYDGDKNYSEVVDVEKAYASVR